MIEAVNSSLAHAQLIRGNVEQVNASRSIADSAPARVAEAPKAPYISPYIAIDTTNNKAVIQIRDRDTGDVEDQFPSQSRLAQLSQQQSRQANATKVKDSVPEVKAPKIEAPATQGADIITVQDVTSSAPSNVSLPSPQVAAAALSAGAQVSQTSASAGVSVLA